MIFTQPKPFEEVLKALEPYKKIFIVGCGECATVFKTGGEEQIAEIRSKLEAAGKTITGAVVVESPCHSAKLKLAVAKNMAAYSAAEVIVVAGCGLGTQSVQENDRSGRRAFGVNNTLGLSRVDAMNRAVECCLGCGDCVINLSAGLCPVTLCPKGLLNGPCGGYSKEGKCEVDREMDCAWVAIYKRMSKDNNFQYLKEFQKAKDHRVDKRPHKPVEIK